MSFKPLQVKISFQEAFVKKFRYEVNEKKGATIPFQIKKVIFSLPSDLELISVSKA